MASEIRIAVVGNHDELVTIRPACFHDRLQALVGYLNGLYNGVENARMPNHVGVGKIQADKIRSVARSTRQLRGDQVHDFVGGHFRLHIIRGHFGTVCHQAAFPIERYLSASAEEERDVRVLFRFCDSDLRAIRRSDDFAQGLGNVGFVVNDVHAFERVIVVGHRHIVQSKRRHLLFGIRSLRQR